MATGVVTDITAIHRTTKFGVKPVYNLNIDGAQYSNGFNKPPCNVGDTVEFEFTSGKYGNEIQKGSLMAKGSGTSTPGSAPTPTAAAPARTYGPPTKPFPIPALHGDRAIVRQNALTNARELFTQCCLDDTLLVEGVAEILKHADAVIAIARRFEAYSCGDMDLEAANKAVEEEKAVTSKKSAALKAATE